MSLSEMIEQHGLLTTAQAVEVRDLLRPRYPHDYDLAKELERRGWLTPYQVNELAMGNVADLVIGPYVILDLVGEGGFGQVFMARHMFMQRLVALKLIRPELVSNPEAIGRFYREVSALSQLKHPNVVLAHDAGPVGDTHFLAMEFVQGVNLQTLVDESGPLEVDQACDYIRQAALGLQHMHDRGLVHRDIKPSNLLVTPMDDPNEASRGASGLSAAMASGQSFPWGLVKVLDLGLARFQETVSEGIDDQLTQAGAGGLRGSADYLSPEQAIDFHTADIRADIYSLGCTFYFLLTGRPPFEGSLALKLLKHQKEEPRSLEQLRSGLPRKLPPIVRKMMAKKPADRYSAPAEAAAAIAGTFRTSWLSLWR
jgi:serine/threonine-protein kinase